MSILELKSDDPARDCHMREALGLDYSRSRFPKDHVCDAQNRLPSQGNDAVAFPDIELRITSSKTLDDPRLLNQGQEIRIVASGTWMIHGVTRPASLQLTASDDLNGAFRVRGRQAFVLSDFGVEVKSANVAIFSSSVRWGDRTLQSAPGAGTSRLGIRLAAREDGDAVARALYLRHGSRDTGVVKFDVKFVGAGGVGPTVFPDLL